MVVHAIDEREPKVRAQATENSVDPTRNVDGTAVAQAYTRNVVESQFTSSNKMVLNLSKTSIEALCSMKRQVGAPQKVLTRGKFT